MNNVKSWFARFLASLRNQPSAKHKPKQTLKDYLLSQSAYENRPNPHWFSQQPAAALYRKAHNITETKSRVPPSAAVQVTLADALALLRRYGLADMLAPEDDATLWAAVISAYWPLPDDAKINIGGLRFAVATFDDQTSMKLQPIEGWCFERVDEKTLQTGTCHDKDVDGIIDSQLRPLPNTTLFMLPFLHYGNEMPTYPNMAVVIERPSLGKPEVVVYNGAQMGHLMGYGRTVIYTRLVGGWQESGRILNHWIS